MKVIYIAGTGHSGSTLLDLMLNAHPEIVSVGELMNLHRRDNSGNGHHFSCSCGARSLEQCGFWSRINERMQSAEGTSIAELGLRSHTNGSGPGAGAIYRAISEISGKAFVVDSSKSPARLAYLMHVNGLDVFPIHLIRNPKGHVYSMLRKHGGFFKHIFWYEFVHERIRQVLKSVPHCVVHYEDLVLKPEGTLHSVLKPLGLSFDRRQLLWAEQTKHLVGGNRMRRSKRSELVLDDAWKQSLKPAHKLMIDLGTLRSRLAMTGTGFVEGA
jgi:hypothetical protein